MIPGYENDYEVRGQTVLRWRCEDCGWVSSHTFVPVCGMDGGSCINCNPPADGYARFKQGRNASRIACPGCREARKAMAESISTWLIGEWFKSGTGLLKTYWISPIGTP